MTQRTTTERGPLITLVVCNWCKCRLSQTLAVITSGPTYWHVHCYDVFKESE